jgi:hypothetical protein
MNLDVLRALGRLTGNQRASPISPNLDHPRLADGCDHAQFTEDIGRNFLVHVDDADSFVGILHAAEGEVGDVDFVLTEQRAHAADDAGDGLKRNWAYRCL